MTAMTVAKTRDGGWRVTIERGKAEDDESMTLTDQERRYLIDMLSADVVAATRYIGVPA